VVKKNPFTTLALHQFPMFLCRHCEDGPQGHANLLELSTLTSTLPEYLGRFDMNHIVFNKVENFQKTFFFKIFFLVKENFKNIIKKFWKYFIFHHNELII
jgi:hypothetical protein